MGPMLEDLRKKIAAAGDAGVTFAKLKPSRKSAEPKFREALAALTRDGSVRGPFVSGKSQVYFAVGHGPTVDKVCQAVEQLVRDAGVRPLNKTALQGKVKGLNARYFPDALKEAISRRSILELALGTSKLYLHRDVAAERFGFEASPAVEPNRVKALGFEELTKVYHRLKAEQGGFTAVKIYDVIRATGAPMTQVHALLLTEAKAGRVVLHPSDSVNLPGEATAAAFRLPGHSEPFVTFSLREGR